MEPTSASYRELHDYDVEDPASRGSGRRFKSAASDAGHRGLGRRFKSAASSRPALKSNASEADVSIVRRREARETTSHTMLSGVRRLLAVVDENFLEEVRERARRSRPCPLRRPAVSLLRRRRSRCYWCCPT
jgi:hypothetical protein